MLHVYHPSKSVKGFALSFWYSPKNNSVFATLIKQHSWDAEREVGVFKASINDPLKKTTTKLSWVEIGAILDCIERNRPFSTYHDQEEPKQIKFEPWNFNLNDKLTQKGFSFSVTVKSKTDKEFTNPFYIGLTFAEARYIREFLLYAMKLNFDSFSYNAPKVLAPEPVSEPTTLLAKEQSVVLSETIIEDSLTGF